MRILGREGADTQKLGNFYLAIVKAVLLFGAETWVITPHIERLLCNFHHRVVRMILGKTQTEGGWDLGVNPIGGRYAGDRVVRYGDLHLQVAEYVRIIHCDATYS